MTNSQNDILLKPIVIDCRGGWRVPKMELIKDKGL